MKFVIRSSRRGRHAPSEPEGDYFRKKRVSSYVDKKNMKLFVKELTVHQVGKQYMRCGTESPEPVSRQPQQTRESTKTKFRCPFCRAPPRRRHAGEEHGYKLQAGPRVRLAVAQVIEPWGKSYTGVAQSGIGKLGWGNVCLFVICEQIHFEMQHVELVEEVNFQPHKSLDRKGDFVRCSKIKKELNKPFHISGARKGCVEMSSEKGKVTVQTNFAPRIKQSEGEVEVWRTRKW